MRIRRLLAAASLALAGQAALAQDYARPGLYAAAHGVASFPTTDLSRVDNGIGAAGRLGYRFAGPFALEAQVEYSGDWGFGDARQTLVTGNAKFHFSSERVQPYLVAGLGATFPASDLRHDDSGFAARVGGGVDFYLTEHVGLLGEVGYVVPTGDLDDLDYVSVGWGLFYRF